MESVSQVEGTLDLKLHEIPSQNELFGKFEIMVLLKKFLSSRGRFIKKLLFDTRKRKEKLSQRNIQKKNILRKGVRKGPQKDKI